MLGDFSDYFEATHALLKLVLHLFIVRAADLLLGLKGGYTVIDHLVGDALYKPI
jgi:hypothetical protein